MTISIKFIKSSKSSVLATQEYKFPVNILLFQPCSQDNLEYFASKVVPILCQLLTGHRKCQDVINYQVLTKI